MCAEQVLPLLWDRDHRKPASDGDDDDMNKVYQGNF